MKNRAGVSWSRGLAILSVIGGASSALAQATTGHDAKGNYILDSSGSFRLNVTGNIVFRYNANFRDGVGNDQDDFTHGFNTRRTFMYFTGFAGDPKLSYRLWTSFNPSTGDLELIEAYSEYAFTDRFSLRFGQSKLPFLQDEYLTGTSNILAVERSLVSSVFSLTYGQGIRPSYTGDDFRVLGMFSDGQRTANTQYDNPTEADYALTGRAEYKWAGDWKQFDSLSSFRGKELAGYVGGAVHWESGGDTGSSNPAGTGTDEEKTFAYTLDTLVLGDGWNASAAFVSRTTEAPRTAPHFTDMGLYVQGGVFVTDSVEPYVRYEHLIPDDDRGANAESFSMLTLGFNYYVFPESHAFKISADVNYAFDAPADSSALLGAGPNTAVGLLPSTEDGQFWLRVQTQVVF